MHVVLHRISRHFSRGLKERSDVHVEPDIGKRRGDDFGAAVVPVLAHLGHEHARPTPLFDGERRYIGHDLLEPAIVGIGRPVHAGDRADLGFVSPENDLQRITDFAHCGPHPRGLHREVEQVGPTRRAFRKCT